LRFKTPLYRLLFLLLLSYGFVYFSYKWLDPTQVNTDFIQYYGMVQHPLDFHVAPSPWVYRQLTAIIAHVFWRLHIYYPNDIQFHNAAYDQRIFFAVLFTNYLAVVAAAWLSTIVVDRELRARHTVSNIFPLFAGMLCFFSFLLQTTTITGQADGLSWTLIALCYLFYERRQLVPFCAVVLISILQREILPLVLLVFTAIPLLTNRGLTGKERKFFTIASAWSAASFALYMVVRHIIHAPGNEYQSDPHAMLHELLHFRPGKAYLMQVGMGQNLLLILFILWFMRWRRFREASQNILTIPVACVMLILLSIAANISNNATRMIAMLTPIVAIEITRALLRLEGREGEPSPALTAR